MLPEQLGIGGKIIRDMDHFAGPGRLDHGAGHTQAAKAVFAACDERFAAQDRGREIFQYPRAPGGGAFHWDFADCAGYLLIVRLAVELAVFRLWALRLVEMDFSIFKNQFSVVGGDFQPVGAGQLAG